MGFISLSFLAFLGVAVLIYYLLPSKIQWVWLLIVSLLFYLTFDLRYIAFLLLSIATTWGGALAVYRLREKQKSGAAKAILALTLLVNIGLLAFLKFGNYSLSLLGRIAALAGVSLTFEPLSLLMPIGISFYTLQAAGYIIDVYRRPGNSGKKSGKVHPVHGFLSPDSAGTDPSIRPARPAAVCTTPLPL